MAILKRRKPRRRRRTKKPPLVLKFSKIAISALLVAVVAFTVAMIVVYIRTGGVPDTLIVAFFGFAGGEAGFMGLIKHSDNKYGAGSGEATTDGTDDKPVG